MLLTRVLLADVEFPEMHRRQSRRPSLRPGFEEEGVTFSSVVALPGVAKGGQQEHVEAVVFCGAQCYPEYMLELEYG